ncbi:ABC transporter ATP-binding protein/permease [Lactobacillus mulieris]|uniref:ATP-binding cassette domain-containing protein n=1 Tax=Lactobacillus mulieris TaxID=2508708 RepID=UPI002242E5EF|nr:ABC transporter ATP-binding protein [Lactobacillus mulieris]MCW8104377.1 ABC transporter ATP-binding protein/permease [Lactobacillus mulieris]
MIYQNYSKFKFFWLNFFGLIYSTENIIMAYMVGSLTNMATKKEFSSLPMLFIQMVIVFTIVLISNLIFNYLKADAIKTTNVKLRTSVLKGMLTSKHEDSANLGFLTNDFKLLETNRYEAEIQILFYSYTVVLALGYSLYLNWMLTLIFLVGASLPAIVSNFFQKQIQTSSVAWTKANDKYVNQTKHLLAGTEVFSLFNKRNAAVAQNRVTVDNLEDKLAKMNLAKNNTNAFLNIIAMGGTFLVPFSIGVMLVIQGQTTLGALFAIIQLSNSFVNPILQILSERNNLTTTKDIVEKIKQLSAQGQKAEKAAISDFNSLEVKDVNLSRQGNKLANGISFTLKKGEKLAVIGPSGSGKSTLLQFLLYGDFGKASALKLDDAVVKAGAFSNLFSYASQKAIIFPESLWFNLTLGADLAESEVRAVCEQLDLGDLVREKGFDYQLGDNADQLSGGQLSRIGLVRAILAKRPVLLLDEINASLDKKTAADVEKYLLNSDLTFIEVNHHYDSESLAKYDQVVDFSKYM